MPPLVLALFLLIETWTFLKAENVTIKLTISTDATVTPEVEVMSVSLYSNEQNDRPIMHTYYQQFGESGSCCGQSVSAHERLVQAWEASWKLQGWETRVLDESDARRHKDYQKLRGILQDMGITEYDQHCYFRWLAMASSPLGGWMSDYDTIALNLTAAYGVQLQHEAAGMFWTFQKHVPALIVANASQWDEKIQEMMVRLPQLEARYGHVSDMYSLLDILNNTASVSQIRNVNRVTLEPPYDKGNGNSAPQINCARAQASLAFHMAHVAVHNSWESLPFASGSLRPLTNKDALGRRYEAAEELTKDYHAICAAAF